MVLVSSAGVGLPRRFAPRNDVFHYSGVSATLFVCFSLNSSNAAAIVSSVVARMAAARRAAFFAPALPIANVPTGMPPGICAIERRLSMPLRALLSTGTPRTGSGVMLAVIPGRCAAPPAPPIMTFRPRDFAVLAYSIKRSGVLCADTILHSWGMLSVCKMSCASFIVSQSDWEPMIMPIFGFSSECVMRDL